MTSLLILTLGSVTAVMLALLWALRKSPSTLPTREPLALNCHPEPGRGHATYLPVICQAMSSIDFRFLAARGARSVVRRAHKERQRIAALYLSQLRDEFRDLLRLARVIAVLSPEVRAGQEGERVWLTVKFFWRYQMVRLALYCGLLLLPQLCALSLLVSQLAAGLEEAIRALGERAALAIDVASQLDRSRLDLA